MTTVQNADMMDGIGAAFQRTDQAIFSWGNAVSAMMALPGLRACWPMGSVNASGQAVDISGQGQSLDQNGTVVFWYKCLIPYCEVDGSTGYLSRTDIP